MILPSVILPSTLWLAAPGGLDLLAEPPTCQTEDWLCRSVRRTTGNDWLAAAADWLIAKPAAIALIVLGALLLRRLAHRLVDRVVAHAGETAPALLDRAGRRTAAQDARAALVAERRRLRAQTMASVLKSMAAVVIFVVAAIMVIGELGYDIGPLVASAGLVGVALGFGAQSLVKDFLSGIFLFFEDQLGVGDRVIVNEVEGVVEALALRVTRIRADDGTVWYVRNGEVLKVGNLSQRDELPEPPPGPGS